MGGEYEGRSADADRPLQIPHYINSHMDWGLLGPLSLKFLQGSSRRFGVSLVPNDCSAVSCRLCYAP